MTCMGRRFKLVFSRVFAYFKPFFEINKIL